ncbi:hypothetical protein EI42_04339 [Thermosporothrix hazakensis]|jgi:hypothetical protein|uniref:Uncharacterized protein n=1 Tax=Thermosporothrix hazakensis TaxID=644383 RepID=A0A326U382_THEHA|nr:hypothetical protein EI42_04339 [Thermosporothrix hazakensis]
MSPAEEAFTEKKEAGEPLWYLPGEAERHFAFKRADDNFARGGSQLYLYLFRNCPNRKYLCIIYLS